MRSHRPLFGAAAFAALLAPSLHAASYERLYGDNSHAETGGFTAATRTCPAAGFLTVGSSVDTQIIAAGMPMTRTAADGAPLWQKTYALGVDLAPRAIVALRHAPGFVVAGEVTFPGTPAPDVFLMKIDCDGTPVWTYSYAGPARLSEEVTGLAETAEGDLVVSGVSFDLESDDNFFEGLLLRTDAAGALRWSRLYAAGNFTAFRAVAADERDIVVVGDRSPDDNTTTHPIVLRLGPDGRLTGRGHCAAEYQTGALFLSVTELAASRHAGEIVIGGEVFDGSSNDLLLVRADPECRPQAARTIAVGAGGGIAEVKRSLPVALAGTVAVASSVPTGTNLTDALLLTVSPSTLAPLAARQFGDHATEETPTTQSELARAVLPLDDGFALAGDSTASDIDPDTFFQDADLYLVKTDGHGNTECSSVAPLPRSASLRLEASPVRTSTTGAGLEGVRHDDVVVTSIDAARSACH